MVMMELLRLQAVSQMVQFPVWETIWINSGQLFIASAHRPYQQYSAKGLKPLPNLNNWNIPSGNIKNLYEAVNKIYKKIRELDQSVADLENMSHEHTSPSDQKSFTTEQTVPTTETSTTYETTTITTFESSGEETYDGDRYKRDVHDSGAGWYLWEYSKSYFDQPAADSKETLYHEIDSLQTQTSDDQIVVRRMRKAVW